MQSYWNIIFSALILGACATPAPLTSGKPGQTLSWLSGCWQSADGGTTEHWIVANDNYAFGNNYNLKDGDVSFFEQMRIEPKTGTLAFQAYPRGVGPSEFLETQRSDKAITFANAAHDYPQKIKYWREGQTLHAQISLIDNTQPNDWQFSPCPVG